jgi:hypothetical protein
MEAALKIQINDSLRAADVDLRTLVSHRTAVQTGDTVESVLALFTKENLEFMAILNGSALVGLCSRHQISELVGGRYGFSSRVSGRFSKRTNRSRWICAWQWSFSNPSLKAMTSKTTCVS